MLNQGLAQNTTRTALDKLVSGGFDYQEQPDIATARDGAIFKQTTTDRSAVIVEQRSGAGYFQTKAEQQDVQQGTVRVGNQQVFTVTEYAQSLPISRTFREDDQHMVVSDSLADMGRTMKLTQDKNAVNVYALGFTTTLTNDGATLYSDTHTTLNGITVDNKETGVLNGTNLNTLIISLARQKTQDGTLGSYRPDFILVPRTLNKTVHETLDSQLRPGTANNDVNYYDTVHGNMQIKCSDFLDDTSTTAYFVGSRQHKVTRWVREAFYSAMVGWETQSNNDFIYKAGYREVVGVPSYEGSIASTGTV